MPLRSENGALLEVKEPIVLDESGNPIFIPSEKKQQTSSSFSSFEFKGTNWFTSLLAIISVSSLLVVGTVFIGALLAVLLGACLIYYVFRFLRDRV